MSEVDGLKPNLLFNTEGTEIKLINVPDSTGAPSYAAIISPDGAERVIHPYADIDVDHTQTQGHFILSIYDKIRHPDKTITYALVSAVAGVATAIVAIKRHRHQG